MTTLPAAMRTTPALGSHSKSPMVFPNKSPRRVLGELTPNAQLTPKHAQLGAKSPIKTAHLQSPLKAQQALNPVFAVAGNENNTSSIPSASKKRPFSAIASPERLNATRSPVKRREAMPFETVSPAALRSPLPPPITVETADDDSETDEEEQAPTSVEHDGDHIELPTATQGTTGSFSSLIDYNPDNASDRSASVSVSPPSSKRSCVPVTSRVEVLKLRLRMAMYKINTNQTLVPFAKLEQPHTRTAAVLDEDQNVEEELPEEPHHSTEVQPPSDNIIITGGPVGKLLGGPIFAPTAFSARFVDAPGNLATPPRRAFVDQQMTPAASPTRLRDERDLTSSVVKGHAASGLLELAHSK